MKRARVIVTTYNNLPLLRLTLRGYLRQTSKDFALTVADDGSRKDTAEFCREFQEDAEDAGIPFLHAWQEDLGFRRSTVLNEGVRRSNGEPLLIFSDADCIPAANLVATHLAAHEEWSFQVGGAHLLSREVSESIERATVDTGEFETYVTDLHRRSTARRRRKTRWGTFLRRRNRPKVFGANLGVDRGLFEALNGFDERFVRWGLEDSDLRDRAMRLLPRPRVKNLYGLTTVFHIWHPIGGNPTRRDNWEYYRQKRPVRCEEGLSRRTEARDAPDPSPPGEVSS